MINRPIIGIFALLLALLFLIIKYCKRKLKIILSVTIILIMGYCIILSVDMNRVYSLREPIFAREKYNTLYMAGYTGLGYEIYFKKFEGEVESVTMHMFGKTIAGAII